MAVHEGAQSNAFLNPFHDLPCRACGDHTREIGEGNGLGPKGFVTEPSCSFFNPEQRSPAGGCALSDAFQLIWVFIATPRTKMIAVERSELLHGAQLRRAEPPRAAGEKRLTHKIPGRADLLEGAYRS